MDMYVGDVILKATLTDDESVFDELVVFVASF